MNQKFQVGERVESGIVTMVWHPSEHLRHVAHQENMNPTDKLIKLNAVWGDWFDNPVYRILLDEPTRQISYEDFLFKQENFSLKYYKPEFYREVYEGLVPLRESLDIPEHLVQAQIVGDGGFDKSKTEEDKNGES